MLYIPGSPPTLVTVSDPGLPLGLDKIMHQQKCPHHRSHVRAEPEASSILIYTCI